MSLLPIVLTCDDKYYKYANVVITSILENLNKNTKYEINILSEYISINNQHITERQIKKYKNVSVNFIELKNFEAEKFFLNSYMNATTYYRFYIPEIFDKYDRILYLDSDLIVDFDISDLATISFNDKLALCCSSPYILKKILQKNDKDYPLEYFTDTLKMNKPEEYFNAGVMVYNLKKIRKNKIQEKLFDALEQIKKPKLQDQDILNSVFSQYGGVKLIDKKFNTTRKYKTTTNRLLLNGLKRKFGLYVNPKLFIIYHYVGQEKPWKSLEFIDSNLFFYYACKSPFIKDILKENNIKISKSKQLLYNYF